MAGLSGTWFSWINTIFKRESCSLTEERKGKFLQTVSLKNKRKKNKGHSTQEELTDSNSATCYK